MYVAYHVAVQVQPVLQSGSRTTASSPPPITNKVTSGLHQMSLLLDISAGDCLVRH